MRLKPGKQIVDVIEGHGVRGRKSPQLEMKPLPILVLVSLWVIFTLACGFNPGAPELATPTVHVELTAAPAALPADFDATVQAVTQALGGSSANGLAVLLANEVALAQGPGALSIETLSHEAALAWLTARWGSRHTIIEKYFVAHFVSIELVTDGGARIAPVQNGVVELHLHRYNAQGQGDALGGRWRVDTILYE